MLSRMGCLSLIAYLALFSTCGLFARNFDFEKPDIFVDREGEIPKSLAERRAYFKVLLDYQKALVMGFTGYLELLYGNVLSPTYLRRYARVETIKADFFAQSEVIQYAGMNIIINDQFSREELFDYSRMIERSYETLRGGGII